MERRDRDDVAEPPLRLNHLHRQTSCGVGVFEKPAVRGGGARDPGDRGAKRLGHDGHRRGGAHRIAVPLAADHRRFGFAEILLRHQTGADLLTETPYVRAAAHCRSPKMAGQHRPAGQHQCREVDRGRGHQQRGNGLVAPSQQDHPVNGVAAQHLLDRHRGQVSPQHRGGPHLRLPRRHHRQVQRNATGLVHALFDAGRDLVEVGVARRQIGGGVGDGDLWPAVERVVRYPAAHPRPVQVVVPRVRPRIPLLRSALRHYVVVSRGGTAVASLLEQFAHP